MFSAYVDVPARSSANHSNLFYRIFRYEVHFAIQTIVRTI
jgi:hypothetical protein